LERGLSQRELACPGVSYAYISRIEAGTRQPSMKALRRLARRLDVTAVFLETGREIDEGQERELRLADAELSLRLGDAVEAELRLRELADAAAAAGDPAMAARARLALALAADERGDHVAAVALFEQAFVGERPSPLERVDVYATLGRAYGALGQTEQEIELYRGCLEEAARVAPESTSAQTRYRILLSYALSDGGQLAAAEEVLRDALPDATADVDPYMQVRVYWSLARLSEMEGRSSAALRFARRAIALLEATEDYVHRARAHLLAAWIMNSAGDGAGARRHLERAGHLLGPAAAAEDAAMLRVERARCEALLGNGDNAVRLAQEGIEMIGDQHDPLLGTAYWALAEGFALVGDTNTASDAFARAVDLLSAHRRWREAAAACRAWAALLRSAGRLQEAAETLEHATELAAHLHARDRRPAAAQPRTGRQR
jgi:tetratricopeptide (TPR) repeat protein